MPLQSIPNAAPLTMTRMLARIAAAGMGIWAFVALFAFARGQHMISGTAFVFLAFSIYFWERTRD